MMAFTPESQADGFVGLLLAAGAGSRFDASGKKNKLLASRASGTSSEPIVAMAARNLMAALPTVIAVVREGDHAVAALLGNLGCRVLACPDSATGLSASLRYGLAQTANAFGWVIALGDMPYVDTSTARALMRAIEAGADVAVPTYRGRRGNPVAFSRTHLPALMQLSGDEGARRLLRTYPVAEVAVDDAGILRDIDTVADLTNDSSQQPGTL